MGCFQASATDGFTHGRPFVYCPMGWGRGRGELKGCGFVSALPSLQACGACASAGGQAGRGLPNAEMPETASMPVLSQGSDLRARIARPYSCPGRSLSPMGRRKAPSPKEATFGLISCRHYGRAEPATPRIGLRRQRWPYGPGHEIDTRGVRFLGITRSFRQHFTHSGLPRESLRSPRTSWMRSID